MPRNEHLTRVELIDPIPHNLGWTGALIREEKTPGWSNIIDGHPVKRSGRTDYLLCQVRTAALLEKRWEMLQSMRAAERQLGAISALPAATLLEFFNFGENARA